MFTKLIVKYEHDFVENVNKNITQNIINVNGIKITIGDYYNFTVPFSICSGDTIYLVCLKYTMNDLSMSERGLVEFVDGYKSLENAIYCQNTILDYIKLKKSYVIPTREDGTTYLFEFPWCESAELIKNGSHFEEIEIVELIVE